MERLVRDLRAAVPAAFESDEYRTRKGAIEDLIEECPCSLLIARRPRTTAEAHVP